MIATTNIAYLQKRVARFHDQAAYKELFLLFYNPLLSFALSFVHSREQAEEIVSDVFIKIWERRSQIQSVANLRVYLYIAVKNGSLNYISSKKRRFTTSIDDVEIELKSLAFNPEQLMITAEMTSLIYKAIDQLPPKCRIIFKLIKEDELKYKEAALILNVSVKTIEKQITIALQKIGHAIGFDIKRTISTPLRTT